MTDLRIELDWIDAKIYGPIDSGLVEYLGKSSQGTF